MRIFISSGDDIFSAMLRRLAERRGHAVSESIKGNAEAIGMNGGNIGDADLVLFDADSPGPPPPDGIPAVAMTFFPISSGFAVTLSRPFTFEKFFASLDDAAKESSDEAAAYSFDDINETVAPSGMTPVSLTAREYKLARTLFDNSPSPVSRAALHDAVFPESTASNTVDVYVNYLRAKLAPRSPVETVRGVGYKWRGEPKK